MLPLSLDGSFLLYFLFFTCTESGFSKQVLCTCSGGESKGICGTGSMATNKARRDRALSRLHPGAVSCPVLYCSATERRYTSAEIIIFCFALLFLLLGGKGGGGGGEVGGRGFLVTIDLKRDRSMHGTFFP